MSKAYSLRLPDDLRAELDAAATEDQRTTHGQILYLLRRALAERAATGKGFHRGASERPPTPRVRAQRVSRVESAN
jgi:hypothetical protein